MCLIASMEIVMKTFRYMYTVTAMMISNVSRYIKNATRTHKNVAISSYYALEISNTYKWFCWGFLAVSFHHLLHIPILVCDLNRTPIVMAQHGGSCVHFSGISTCGRTSRETVSHPQRQILPTPYRISLSVDVILTNKRLQPLLNGSNL